MPDLEYLLNVQSSGPEAKDAADFWILPQILGNWNNFYQQGNSKYDIIVYPEVVENTDRGGINMTKAVTQTQDMSSNCTIPAVIF